MPEKSRYIPREVNYLVQRRAKGQCECCGCMQIPDRHHIKEYHLGGEHSAENIILLCPSCHRDIPKFLTKKQQMQLQEWHIGYSKSSTFQYNPKTKMYGVGEILFFDSDCVIKAGDQNIISATFMGGKLYLNAVMLNNFQNKMLILSNKVITADKSITITTEDDMIRVSEGSNTLIAINSDVKATHNDTGITQNIPWIRFSIIYKEKLFRATDTETVLPGISSAKGAQIHSLNLSIDVDTALMQWTMPQKKK